MVQRLSAADHLYKGLFFHKIRNVMTVFAKLNHLIALSQLNAVTLS
jgi:hypothetical protein